MRIRKQEMKDITEEGSPCQTEASQEERDISDSKLSDEEQDSTSNQDTQKKPEEILIDTVHASPLENFLSKAGSQKHKDSSKKVINLLTAVVDML